MSPNQEFLIRRARVILSGDVSDHLYVYIQPDFASTPNSAVDRIEFAQIRDWYGDVYIDKEKVNRLRIGQSKRRKPGQVLLMRKTGRCGM